MEVFDRRVASVKMSFSMDSCCHFASDCKQKDFHWSDEMNWQTLNTYKTHTRTHIYIYPRKCTHKKADALAHTTHRQHTYTCIKTNPRTHAWTHTHTDVPVTNTCCRNTYIFMDMQWSCFICRSDIRERGRQAVSEVFKAYDKLKKYMENVRLRAKQSIVLGGCWIIQGLASTRFKFWMDVQTKHCPSIHNLLCIKDK